jgi:hypothetical protein
VLKHLLAETINAFALAAINVIVTFFIKINTVRTVNLLTRIVNAFAVATVKVILAIFVNLNTIITVNLLAEAIDAISITAIKVILAFLIKLHTVRILKFFANVVNAFSFAAIHVFFTIVARVDAKDIVIAHPIDAFTVTAGITQFATARKLNALFWTLSGRCFIRCLLSGGRFIRCLRRRRRCCSRCAVVEWSLSRQ